MAKKQVINLRLGKAEHLNTAITYNFYARRKKDLPASIIISLDGGKSWSKRLPVKYIKGNNWHKSYPLLSSKQVKNVMYYGYKDNKVVIQLDSTFTKEM